MEEFSLIRKKVYDPMLRTLHTVLGLSTLVLLLTGWSSDLFDLGQDKASLWLVHIYTGYVFSVALVGRMLWGFFGPPTARWVNLWHWPLWMNQLKYRKVQKNYGQFGHDPNASLAYLGFYVLALMMLVSGLTLSAIEHGQGPLSVTLFDRLDLKEFFAEPHDLGSSLIAAFIFVHVAALLWHEREQPMVQSMFSGYQYRKKGANEREKL